MIKIIGILLSLVCINAVCFAGQQNWQELKDEHFIVHYMPASASSSLVSSQPQMSTDSFARQVLFEAERYYQRIALELGYARSSEFWTWDKRVKIYIYSNRETYQASGNYPPWSEGMADYKKKAILSFAGSASFVDSILPHEIAHLVFRDFVGLRGDIPLWLDEGVAQWAEEKKTPQVKSLVKLMFLKDSLLTLDDMMKLDIRTIVHKNNVYIRPTITRQGDRGVLFLTGDALVNSYYMEAASLVSFMIDKYGSMEFSNFCRQLRDGKSVEDAVKNVYYTHIRDMVEFEMCWRKYIEEVK
ncbi:MAG: hypothetical protein WC547_02085 [Candidatus Omnitrophota bacterium]